MIKIKRILYQIFLGVMVFTIVSCNSTTKDNVDGKQDNFKFSEDQLGILSFDHTTLDFGKVVLEEVRKKYITITNTGKLPLIFEETTFNGNSAAGNFYYSGEARAFPGEGGDCRERLESEDSCVIAITYLPLERKEDYLEFKIFYNNGLRKDSSKMYFKAYGGERASLSFSSESLDFPFMDQGDSRELEVTILNDGGQVARNFTLSLNQSLDSMGREVFEVVPSKTTCPVIPNQSLDIGASCSITIKSTSALDQEYQNYIASLGVSYEYNPNDTLVDTLSIDAIQKVVSVEGELFIPVTSVDFGNVVNGFITEKNFLVQNIGYKTLSLETVNISGDGGSAYVDIRDCTERSNETYNASNKLLLNPSQSCIIGLRFSPNFGVIPFDFSSSNIYFTFNDGKNGVRISESVTFSASLVNPADIIVKDAADPHLENWLIGDVFVANDTRFNLNKTYTIRNIGDVLSDNINIVKTGSPYYSVSHDCPLKLAKETECTVTLNFTPIKSIYDTTASLDANATISVNYEAGNSVSFGVPLISQTVIDAVGTINDLPQLMFNSFDSSLTGTTIGVAGSSSFYDVVIKNLGVTTETNFSLIISNSSDYAVVDDVSLTDIGGNPNCAHIDNGAGVLASGSLCTYRIRSFSAVPADISTNLNISFQGGAQTSATFTYSASFVNPAKLSLANPIPETKSMIRSYTDFNYPGVGSSTNINDSSVTSFYSTGARSVDPTLMNFPALPGSETFDFAYLELGYVSYGATQVSQFDIKNIGEYEMEVRDFSLTEVRNMISLTDVTSSGYITLASASCIPGANPVKVGADGNCSAKMNINLPDDSLYRAKFEVTYTLGHKSTPTSDTLITYTSSVYAYVKGYNSSLYAQINPFAPSSFAADKEISLSEVFGGDNAETKIGTIRNSSSFTATNIHYTITENSDFLDISSDSLAVSNMTAASAPLTNYYRLASSECTGGVSDELSAGNSCDLTITYTPTQEEQRELLFYYRYYNGLTFEENHFKIILNGIKPADLVVKNLTATAFPKYIKEFGDQVVEGIHEEFVEVKNEGGADATNLNLNITLDPFKILPSDHPDLDACGATVSPDETCYIKLVYQPTYSFLEINSLEDIAFTWENGVKNSGVPDIASTIFTASGYAEEKHSLHQGWSSIKISGYNKAYADYLELNDIRKGSGAFYGPHELGLVELRWNKMADDGVIPNPISGYAVYKSPTKLFNIKTDTIYRTIPYVMGQNEYILLDDTLDNAPGKVWFYYVVPIRSGKLSKVDLEVFPIAAIRVMIPHSYSVGIHRYMASMQVCKKMGLDVNDPNNIDLESNGCKYKDSLGDDKIFSVNYDTHTDMYEAGVSYSLQPLISINAPGDNATVATLSEARNICQAKRVNFVTTDPALTGFYYKDLPNRREHFYLSQKDGGYTQEDCEIKSNEIITGNQTNCLSDLGLENMVGGLPEWTLAQIDGYGKGIATTMASGPLENSINGINYSLMFNPALTGANKFLINSMSDPIDQRCFNAVTGMFNPKSFGDCNGDHLLGLTNNPALATPTKLYLASTEPQSTEFEMFLLNSTISESSSFKIYSVAGGGDKLSSTAPKNNYSPYTTKFIFGFTDDIGFRCSTRIGY